MDPSTTNLALFVFSGLSRVVWIALLIAYIHCCCQEHNLAVSEFKVATAKPITDLETQHIGPTQPLVRRPGFTLTETDGIQSFSPTVAGRKAWSDPGNPPPLPPLPTHRLPGDWDISFLISKPAGIAPSFCWNVAPPVGKMGDACMEVLKHEGEEMMCVRLKLGPPRKVEIGTPGSYWGRFTHKAETAKEPVGDDEKQRGKGNADVESAAKGGDVEWQKERTC
jgi:hypothetical protein